MILTIQQFFFFFFFFNCSSFFFCMIWTMVQTSWGSPFFTRESFILFGALQLRMYATLNVLCEISLDVHGNLQCYYLI